MTMTFRLDRGVAPKANGEESSSAPPRTRPEAERRNSRRVKESCWEMWTGEVTALPRFPASQNKRTGGFRRAAYRDQKGVARGAAGRFSVLPGRDLFLRCGGRLAPGGSGRRRDPH